MYTPKHKAKSIGSALEPWSVSLWLIAIHLVASGITRLALVWMNFPLLADSVLMVPISFLVGVIFDVYVALCVTSPLVLVMLILPVRWRSSLAVRWLTSVAGFVFIFGNLYLGVAELFFFEEFSSRFNYVAVDYLIYPHEVFVNILDTYPVLTVISVAGVLSLILTWLVGKKVYSGVLAYPRSFDGRLGTAVSYGLLIALMSFTLNIDVARISNNRILNEIASNGVYSFMHSALTNELDYNRYYKKIDEQRAFHRLRQLLDDPNSTFLYSDTSKTIARYVSSDRQQHRFNVVVVLEESFGSHFIGTLHPEGPCLTPRFDTLIQEGMLFSSVYATGNRTVRGLEASLLSFPPIPGRSVVKRPGCENLFSLPSVLKGFDYNTVFLYGGLSYFDNFGHFASTNGFDQIIDETDIEDPTFSTIWGVCDEDLFAHSLEVFDTLAADGKPFFATMITVSNHSPFTYPKGRIPQDPEARRRENAVRYADFAIGEFLQNARSHSYFDSTLFVFVADHGARVYGSEQMPIRSYEIPLLFYCPALVPDGVVIDMVGSQMDLAPTVLDFLGIDYNSMFFGRSLLATPEEAARALMSHNRDVSLLQGNFQAVLGIRGGQELWFRDSSGTFSPVDDTGSPLVEDAIAYYMTAYNMFMSRQLHPLDQKATTR